MRVAMTARRGIKAASLAGIMGAMLVWVTPGTGLAQQETILQGGKMSFQRLCQTCHGPEAKGDGVVANLLTVKPADLTQINKRNNGDFPFWRIYRMIDGREEVKGHGTREMPIWGQEFVRESTGPAEEAVARARILELVHYLQSIQEE